MNVTLLSHTPDALNLLLRTKNTRLGFDADPSTWPEEKKAEHLAYMLDTIKSSWEFVDYTFQIDDVSRAFTHQLVRSRTGSYAQESQRTVDVSKHGVMMPPMLRDSDNGVAAAMWEIAADEAMSTYAELMAAGIPAQDARGILPTNVLTSIVCKFNLRSLSDMAKLRLCTRTQGEYQDVFRLMRSRVLEVHPWTEAFLQVHCVATGTCAFPRYGKVECPVYLPEMDNTAVREAAKLKFWGVRHEATPIAREGKAS
jgi:flavin-dependent thymidylate synthase